MKGGEAGKTQDATSEMRWVLSKWAVKAEGCPRCLAGEISQAHESSTQPAAEPHIQPPPGRPSLHHGCWRGGWRVMLSLGRRRWMVSRLNSTLLPTVDVSKSNPGACECYLESLHRCN